MAEENKELLIPFLTYSKSWREPDDFPTYEPSEERVRDDMQWLYDEIQVYLNNNVAGTLCQVIKNHLDAPVVTDVKFRTVATSGDDFTLTLDVTASDGKVATTTCQMKDVAEAVRGVIGSGIKSIAYDSTGPAWVFTYTDGKVERIEMPSSERNAISWTSLDTPGSAHTPAAGYAVGLQWLRPAFTVKNNALASWTMTKGSVANGTNSWTFTADGSSGSLQASQSVGKIGDPGQKVHVYVLAEGIASHQNTLTLVLNEVSHNLKTGGGVYEVNLDSAGKLNIGVNGTWNYSASAATFVLRNLTVVNSTAINAAAVGCRPLSDWPAFIRTYAPFAQVNMPRAVFVQESPGNWVPISYDVQPVIHGGTGLTQVQSGALLMGAGEAALQPLVPGTNGRVLQMVSGKPAWADFTGAVTSAGFPRYAEGTYTGSSAARTVTLSVTPKILWISGQKPNKYAWQAGDKEDESVTLLPGTKLASAVYSEESTSISPSNVWVELTGNTLKFTGPTSSNPTYLPKFMNVSGYTYKWLALY